MTLIHLGFNVHFLNWVMSCVLFVSFSILVNERALAFFEPNRGLRKGCPLSPPLFLIMVEGLSRDLIEAKRVGSLQRNQN
jgi:hypothetical protein